MFGNHQTLNLVTRPRPYTLSPINPKPNLTGPNPYPLNPKPGIPNPKPKALNPKPETLNLTGPKLLGLLGQLLLEGHRILGFHTIGSFALTLHLSGFRV